MRQRTAERAAASAFALADLGVVLAPAVVLAVTARKGGLPGSHGTDLLVASGVVGLVHAGITFRRLTDEARLATRRVDAWLAEIDALVVLALGATLLLIAVLGGFAEEHGVLVNEGWPVIALWTGVQVLAVLLSEVTSRGLFRWLEEGARAEPALALVGLGATVAGRRWSVAVPVARPTPVVPPVNRSRRPAVVGLDDPRALDAALVGTKAANLARSAASALPALPGFVVTTAAEPAVAGAADIRAAWAALTDGGRRPLAVRSSSTAEDLADRSLAGRFESVLDVADWVGFTDAVDRVRASARSAAVGSDDLVGDEPIAVLVQPMLSAVTGGVLFGADPVSGRGDRIVVVASPEGPEAVVAGRTHTERYVLDATGLVLAEEPGPDGSTLDGRALRDLVVLSRLTADLFEGPQDVEWAIDDEGRVVLLQSRPVTTPVVGPPQGPRWGRGPVAETFPRALAPLEEDLWVPALREGVHRALLLSGAATGSDLAGTELVRTVDGLVVVDLDATGESPDRRRLRRHLSLRRPVRRLVSAWRIGRLRAGLPALAEDLITVADRHLRSVPALQELSDVRLLGVLDRVHEALRSVHAHEILLGRLVGPGASPLTGTAVALRVVAHARSSGLDDDEIVRRHPVALALTPPRIGRVPLPARVEVPHDDGADRAGDRDRNAVLREALRLRARWLQELGARTAEELGARLSDRGELDDAAFLRLLRLDELRRAVIGGALPPDLTDRVAPTDHELPATFRLSADGDPVAEPLPLTPGTGTGAGGGVGRGVVRHDPTLVDDGDVLVVRTLDPALAPSLRRLRGLVAETGNVLAHLAILAREAGVPTVIGAVGAVDRFPEGSLVEVDGTAGTVREVEGP